MYKSLCSIVKYNLMCNIIYGNNTIEYTNIILAQPRYFTEQSYENMFLLIEIKIICWYHMTKFFVVENIEKVSRIFLSK